jgi:hypothetical protein
MARSTLSYTLVDWGNETAVVQFNGVEYNTVTYSQYLTDIGGFRTNLVGTGATGISWGGLRQEKQTLFIDDLSAIPPTDENFLNGRKWLVRYQDIATFKKYSCEIPCAKTAGLLLPRSEKADLSVGAWQTFKNAFEAVVRSDEGNDVEIISARLVGRKL